MVFFVQKDVHLGEEGVIGDSYETSPGIQEIRRAF
jgi:hypothetical protein